MPISPGLLRLLSTRLGGISLLNVSPPSPFFRSVLTAFPPTEMQRQPSLVDQFAKHQGRLSPRTKNVSPVPHHRPNVSLTVIRF